MVTYEFGCKMCDIYFDEERPMTSENLSTAICPVCGSEAGRIFSVPEYIDNLMNPGMTKKQTQVLKDANYSEELPTPQFWKDVHNGKVVKKGNIWKRLKD